MVRMAKRDFNKLGKAFLAVWLIGSILLAAAAGTAPSLHKLFHADADQPGHTCAVTLFAHGQVDSATVEISVVAPTVSVETTSPFAFSVFAPAIENLPAGRAPPVSVFSPV